VQLFSQAAHAVPGAAAQSVHVILSIASTLVAKAVRIKMASVDFMASSLKSGAGKIGRIVTGCRPNGNAISSLDESRRPAAASVLDSVFTPSMLGACRSTVTPRWKPLGIRFALRHLEPMHRMSVFQPSCKTNKNVRPHRNQLPPVKSRRRVGRWRSSRGQHKYSRP
jgi:hypothetical protein